jgi:hypothetical protein
METVSEHEATTPAEEVIVADAGDNAHADGEDADTVGEMPLPESNRGVRRLKSSASAARRGPQRGGVKRATSMRAGQQPPNAQPSLMRVAAVGVGRSTSTQSGLSRASTTGSTSNSSIGRPSHHSYQRGPSATLQRNESEMSLGDVSISDGSVFTMDSVSLRKGQMIADPLDHGTYAGEDSFADHESFMTRDDFVPIQEAASPVRREIKPRISGLDALNFTEKLQIGGIGDASIVSFMTGASGLTTDYTEDSEYGCEEVHRTAE